MEIGCDFIFKGFGVHPSGSVVIVHHDDRASVAPDAEHGAVYYVGEGTLRIVSNCLSKSIWIVSSAKEGTFAPSE